MSGISQKWFSHLIFSLGSQAPFADTEETAKLCICLGFPTHPPFFANVKELKKGKKKKEGKKLPQNRTARLNNFKLSVSFPSPRL